MNPNDTNPATNGTEDQPTINSPDYTPGVANSQVSPTQETQPPQPNTQANEATTEYIADMLRLSESQIDKLEDLDSDKADELFAQIIQKVMPLVS